MIQYGSGNVHTFNDVHTYDTVLDKTNLILTRFTIPEKVELINKLIQNILLLASPNVRIPGMQGIELIRNSVGTSSNGPSPDHMFACDVASEISVMMSKISDEDVKKNIINTICEQMNDMIVTHGFCVSGRVNRLFNVYLFVKEYVEKSLKV